MDPIHSLYNKLFMSRKRPFQTQEQESRSLPFIQEKIYV